MKLIDFPGNQLEKLFVRFIIQSALPDAITVTDIIGECERDKEMKTLAEMIQKGAKELPAELADFKKNFDELSCSPEGLVLRGTNIIIPLALRRKVVERAHVGHQGIVKT
ncbi:unnamed protein product [Brachionus calyciflorus]|uniref:Uncharacterized protein n=1 Tax=Brachionus calyciflorus TaxID=104777 RepID=A0A814LJY9_9BILA|nr:unnamed protein product [Brachionus calyciflorus]